MYCEKLNDFFKNESTTTDKSSEIQGKNATKKILRFLTIYIYYSDTLQYFFDTHKSLIFQGFYAHHFYNFLQSGGFINSFTRRK